MPDKPLITHIYLPAEDEPAQVPDIYSGSDREILGRLFELKDAQSATRSGAASSNGSGLEPLLPPIGKHALAALVKINNVAPMLCTLDEIAFDRKTAGKLVKELIAAGYACRPQGDRRGATVTAAGKQLAISISQVPH